MAAHAVGASSELRSLFLAKNPRDIKTKCSRGTGPAEPVGTLDVAGGAIGVKQRKRVVLCTLGVPDEREGASLVIIYNFIAPLRSADFKVLHIVLLDEQPKSE